MTTPSAVRIDGTRLTLAEVYAVACRNATVELDDAVRPRIAAARDLVERTIEAGERVYGVTTGFGRLKNVKIAPASALELQTNLVRSHAAGAGDALPRDAVRAAMLLRAQSLARGNSGVRQEIVDVLLAMLNRDVVPVIPALGSVGSSGDLAPLAHMALVLIGEGEAYHDGKRVPGARALADAGIKPVALSYKEGVSLINGTQIMTAIGVLCAMRAAMLCKAADIAGAMSLEAFLGSVAACDERLSELRPYAGQARVAANIRHLLHGSEVVKSHEGCDRVQDPYSFRCMPVVHGAVRDTLRFVEQTLDTEINSVTDNPIAFPEDGDFVSGGNFHGEPVALAMDYLAIALTELGSISERRSYKLTEGDEGLPPFLTAHHGLCNGFMLAQYTAAALVSECKVLAHPASVDSIPTSAGQEDHNSMGTIAARKCATVLEYIENVVAVELLEAAQALDFRAPLGFGEGTAIAHGTLRGRIPHLEQDRELSTDIAAARAMISSGELVGTVEAKLGGL